MTNTACDRLLPRYVFDVPDGHSHPPMRKLEPRGKSELPGVNEIEQGHRIVIGHSASWLNIVHAHWQRTVHD